LNPSTMNKGALCSKEHAASLIHLR
jgi:hypothetical protein